MQKRFTIHYTVGGSEPKEAWATWYGKGESQVEEDFLIEHPNADIVEIIEEEN